MRENFNRLIAHLYGELTPSDEERLLAEVANHQSLDRQLTELRKLLTAYRLTPQIEAPPTAEVIEEIIAQRNHNENKINEPAATKIEPAAIITSPEIVATPEISAAPKIAESEPTPIMITIRESENGAMLDVQTLITPAPTAPSATTMTISRTTIFVRLAAVVVMAILIYGAITLTNKKPEQLNKSEKIIVTKKTLPPAITPDDFMTPHLEPAEIFTEPEVITTLNAPLEIPAVDKNSSSETPPVPPTETLTTTEKLLVQLPEVHESQDFIVAQIPLVHENKNDAIIFPPDDLTHLVPPEIHENPAEISALPLTEPTPPAATTNTENAAETPIVAQNFSEFLQKAQNLFNEDKIVSVLFVLDDEQIATLDETEKIVALVLKARAELKLHRLQDMEKTIARLREISAIDAQALFRLRDLALRQKNVVAEIVIENNEVKKNDYYIIEPYRSNVSTPSPLRHETGKKFTTDPYEYRK